MSESAGRRELRALIGAVESDPKSMQDLLDWFDSYKIWKGPQGGPRGGRRYRTAYQVDVTKYRPFLMSGASYLPTLTEAVLAASRSALSYKMSKESV